MQQNQANDGLEAWNCSLKNREITMKIKALVVVASLLAVVSCTPPQTYKVSTSLYHQGGLMASPVMVVEAGQASSFTLGDDVSYEFTLTPQSDQTVKVATTVVQKGERMQPELIVAYDQEASMEMGPQKLVVLVSKTAP